MSEDQLVFRRWVVECSHCEDRHTFVIEGKSADGADLMREARDEELRAMGFEITDNGIIRCSDCVPFRSDS